MFLALKFPLPIFLLRHFHQDVSFRVLHSSDMHRKACQRQRRPWRWEYCPPAVVTSLQSQQYYVPVLGRHFQFGVVRLEDAMRFGGLRAEGEYVVPAHCWNKIHVLRSGATTDLPVMRYGQWFVPPLVNQTLVRRTLPFSEVHQWFHEARWWQQRRYGDGEEQYGNDDDDDFEDDDESTDATLSLPLRPLPPPSPLRLSPPSPPQPPPPPPRLASTEAKETRGDECAICLEPVLQAERISHLKCAHLFHTACIQQWVEKVSTCPLCRKSAATV